MTILQKLETLRSAGGTRLTQGLPDSEIERFAARAPELAQAVDAALAMFAEVQSEYPALIAMDEADQCRDVQSGFVNFYQENAVNPYVALAARGPWIVTLKGAVVHDSGGYGMLGFGHTPAAVLEALARPQVMANIMTPQLGQKRFTDALRREVGHTRGGCPYVRFLCLNSGSESVSLAGRIADVNAKLMTDAGAPHAGWRIKRLAIKGGFHGRTELPAHYSDSSRKTYAQHLASHRGSDQDIITI
jgi:4-aminobutyrate aminotransferase-like enzyme